MDLIVPDRTKSIREGAIAPWNSPAYMHELDELMALADDYDIPVDVPFSELDERQVRLIAEGVPERKFGGLAGFFDWLQRRKYKMHIRVFLSRWRSYRTCPACGGAPAPARGAGHARRRPEHRRGLGDEDPRRGRVLSASGAQRLSSGPSAGRCSNRSSAGWATSNRSAWAT